MFFLLDTYFPIRLELNLPKHYDLQCQILFTWLFELKVHGNDIQSYNWPYYQGIQETQKMSSKGQVGQKKPKENKITKFCKFFT